MQIRVINDIHWETAPFTISKCDEDKNRILIIAGDLAIPEFQKKALESICDGFRHVLYVPGNHEYEGEDIATYDIGEKFSYIENLTVMTNAKTQIIDNYAFCGTTLWTDFLNGDWFCMHNAKDNVSDYEYIRSGGRKFNPTDAYELHKRELNQLQVLISHLRQAKNNGTISGFSIITHHSPSRKSMDPNFKLPMMLEGIFYSDLDVVVGYSEADFWFHGHIHSSCDYFLGDTRVICNPRGNGNWMNVEFNENFILNV